MPDCSPTERSGAAGVVALAAAFIFVFGLSGCGDSTGVWPRYQLERAYYKAQKELDRADLLGKSGQAADLPALRAAFEDVVELYARTASEFGADDTTLNLLGAQAYLRLADIYAADSGWNLAAHQYEIVAAGDQFAAQYKNMALMGLGRMNERLDNYLAAAHQYRTLLQTLYPPVGTGGINRDVMALPRRLILIAKDHVSDSSSVWEAEAFRYYNSLAEAYPHTEVGMAALGELGTLYAQKQDWQRVIATLKRAADTTGAIMPPYWIDIGEITANQLHDTVRALDIYAQVASAFSESPFRVDADMKRAQIHMRRGEYSDARTLLVSLKEQFPDRPAVMAAAQLMFASAVEAEGNWERAKNEYLVLTTTYPRSLEAVHAALAIAHHLARSGETDRVDEWYNRADELAAVLARPDRYAPAMAGTAMDLRVSIAGERKQWDDVAARLNDIINAFSDRSSAGGQALYRLGLLHLRERADTAAAAVAWRRFLEAQPNHPQLQVLRDEMNKWPSTYNQDSAS